MTDLERPTVYLVWEGLHSDKDVMAVFTDKGLADRYIELYGQDDTRLEEVETNPVQREMHAGIRQYTVVMAEDGSSEFWDAPEAPTGEQHYEIMHGTGRLYALVHATSEAQAVRIVNEKRNWLLANDLWKEGRVE